jgi:DNA-binding NarL/FixJ family response regulator
MRRSETGSDEISQAALDTIEAESVGVVVCDVGMPGMSGIEFAQGYLYGRPDRLGGVASRTP